VAALAYPFQFLVLAEFIGFFPVRQDLAQPGKLLKPVFPEKEPVDPFRVIGSQGSHGIQPADRQLIGQFITHRP
jgi:hypothetical protein